MNLIFLVKKYVINDVYAFSIERNYLWKYERYKILFFILKVWENVFSKLIKNMSD